MLRRRAGTGAARTAWSTFAALALAGVVLSAVPGAASAACRNVYRAYPDGSSALVLVCDSPEGSGKSTAKSSPPGARQPTPAQYRALRYVPSGAVSAALRDTLTERFAVGPQAEVIRAEVQSGVYVRDFHEAVREQGWSTRDFGDAYSYAYMLMWLVVNDRRTVSDEVAAAVRRDLRRRLALDPRVRRADDAAQQAHAERLASYAVLLSSNQNLARQSGDAQRVADTRRSARLVASDRDQLGVDLSKVRLTSKGAVGTAGGPRVQR